MKTYHLHKPQTYQPNIIAANTTPPPYHYSLQGVTRVVAKAMMIVFHERYKFYVHTCRIAMIFIFQSIIKMIHAHVIYMLHILMECALVHIIFLVDLPIYSFIIIIVYQHHPSGITRSKINTRSHMHNIFIIYILLNAINKEILNSCIVVIPIHTCTSLSAAHIIFYKEAHLYASSHVKIILKLFGLG